MINIKNLDNFIEELEEWLSYIGNLYIIKLGYKNKLLIYFYIILNLIVV